MTIFLSKVQKHEPNTVRIMLTGNADLQAAISAVNEGNIFRFLRKPCEPEVFASAMNTALEQYRLIQAEKLLLEKTVRGSIQVLSEVLALVNPIAFGQANRIQGHVSQLVCHLKLENPWQYESAALLCKLGCVAIPMEILEKVTSGEDLSPEQQAMVERHPQVANKLLSKIPRLEPVAEMIWPLARIHE